MTVKSTIKIDDYSAEWKREIKKLTLKGLEQSTAVIKGKLNSETPFRTGKLRRSNDVTVDRNESALRIETGGPGARHANLIIYGTPYTAANDYLARTARKTKRTVGDNLKRMLSL
jgi:hypothetical protein